MMCELSGNEPDNGGVRGWMVGKNLFTSALQLKRAK